MKTFDPRLYFVHDHGFKPSPAALTAALKGGARMVQLRAKGLTRDEFRAWATPALRLARAYGATLIINDEVELARELAADGVHVGHRDMPVARARELLGPEALIGYSLESVDQIDAPDARLADYVAASGVFPTRTKTDLPGHLGLEGLRALRSRTAQPLVAIGGIHAGNASAVFSSGADGIALISAIAGADDPQLATAELWDIARRAALGSDLPPRHPAETVRGRARWRDPRALTIAGSDSGGGAGVQADLKTMTALGVFGTSALTALTAQNTTGVSAVFDVDDDFLRAQLRAVLDDLGTDAVKIGMLHRRGIVRTVGEELAARPHLPVILDPVMVAKGGHRLIEADTVAALIEVLFPLASLVTPNLSEAATLLEAAGAPCGDLARASRDELRAVAARLLELGPAAVLLKGGHHDSAQAADLLLTRDGGEHWFEAPRTETLNLHGTGCSLSSAIAAFTARGYPLAVATAKAKAYVTEAIRSGARFHWGEGHGPIDHIHPHR